MASKDCTAWSASRAGRSPWASAPTVWPESRWRRSSGRSPASSRELEEARKLIRELVDDEDAGIVWTGTRVVCAYCSATDRYDVEHDRDCPIERARRALAADTEVSDGEI